MGAETGGCNTIHWQVYGGVICFVLREFQQGRTSTKSCRFSVCALFLLAKHPGLSLLIPTKELRHEQVRKLSAPFRTFLY